jgi:hypothetical protein
MIESCGVTPACRKWSESLQATESNLMRWPRSWGKVDAMERWWGVYKIGMPPDDLLQSPLNRSVGRIGG